MTWFLMLDVKTRRNLSRHKISCRDIDYCNLKNPIETLYEEMMSRQSDECREARRQGFWSRQRNKVSTRDAELVN